MDQPECGEWIRLVDDYGRAAAELAKCRAPSSRATNERLIAAGLESQHAWDALEQHMREHGCQPVYPAALPMASSPGPALNVDHILAKAADASWDVILVADDDRRFVELNSAGVKLLGLPRDEIVGKRIDDFFSEAGGRTIPDAWAGFVAKGVQSGVCELISPNRRRKFNYRAKANFMPGLHMSVLQDLPAELDA